MAAYDDDAVLFERVEEGLRLLAAVDPLRHRRLLRFVRRIVITGTSRALYAPELKACVLGYPQVLTDTPEQIAASVVHESVHARIRKVGIPVGSATIAREERLCVKETLTFLEKTPAGGSETGAIYRRG